MLSTDLYDAVYLIDDVLSEGYKRTNSLDIRRRFETNIEVRRPYDGNE